LVEVESSGAAKTANELEQMVRPSLAFSVTVNAAQF
jgi:hypothetical protein